MLNLKNSIDMMRILGVVAVVLLFCGILRYCDSTTVYTQGVKQGVTVQALEEVKHDLKDSEKQHEVLEAVTEIKVEAVSNAKVHEVKVVKQAQLRMEKAVKAVQVVKEDPAKINEQKDKEIAAIQIDALWEAHCSYLGSDCKT